MPVYRSSPCLKRCPTQGGFAHLRIISSVISGDRLLVDMGESFTFGRPFSGLSCGVDREWFRSRVRCFGV